MTSLVKNFHNHKRIFACGKFPWSWKTSLVAENFLDFKKFPWLWKISLIVENFLDFGKCFWLWKTSFIAENFLDCKRFPWSSKNLCLWETFLIMENFLDQGKIFACGKLPWSRKNLGLWKTSLFKEKSWLVENFLDQGKIRDLSLLGMKSYDTTNASVQTIKVYFWVWSKNWTRLPFCQRKVFCARQNQYYFCFDKNHSQPKPVEQLLSLSDLIQRNIDDV